MRGIFPSAAALAAAMCISGVSFAQAPSAGSTPGSGLVTVDLTGTPTSTPGLASPQPAECLDQTGGSGGPWALVAPYGWVFGIKGTVGAGRRTVTVDQSVGDSVDVLKDHLEGAAQLHVESGYGRAGLIADLTYLQLTAGGPRVSLDFQSTLFELLGMYRVLDPGGRQPGAVTFDVLAGARYYRFSNEISGNLFGLPFSVERTNQWIDLVVGARAGVQVTEDLGAFVRGDVGGFGLGNSSERACNVIVGFEYRCCECASLVGGYRWFKIDREAGAGRDRFLLDATLSGPFAAFTFRF